MELNHETMAILAIQSLFALVMYFFKNTLADIKRDIENNGTRLQTLNDTVLGKCVMQPLCEARSAEEWHAIEDLQHTVGKIAVDVGRLKAQVARDNDSVDTHI